MRMQDTLDVMDDVEPDQAELFDVDEIEDEDVDEIEASLIPTRVDGERDSK